MNELGLSPWIKLVDIVTVSVGELVPGVRLPQDEQHAGDVVDDKPGEPRYVVLGDYEIPYEPS